MPGPACGWSSHRAPGRGPSPAQSHEHARPAPRCGVLGARRSDASSPARTPRRAAVRHRDRARRRRARQQAGNREASPVARRGRARHAGPHRTRGALRPDARAARGRGGVDDDRRCPVGPETGPPATEARSREIIPPKAGKFGGMAKTDANPPMPDFVTDYELQEVDPAFLTSAVKPKQFLHIDQAECILYEGCVDICPWKCIHMVSVDAIADATDTEQPGEDPTDHVAFIVDEDVCTRCALCVDRCPTGVIILGKISQQIAEGDPHTRTDRHGYSYGVRF